MNIKRNDYSEFLGKEFLNEFLLARNTAINDLKKLKYKRIKNENYFDFVVNLPKKSPIEINNELLGKINLKESLLHAIQLYCQNNTANINLINRLIHKAEVQKCIYEYYSANLVKGYGANDSLLIYALASILFALHYSANNSIQALNLILKINDYIIQFYNKIELDTIPVDLILLSFIYENQFITNLIEDKILYE